MTRDVPPDLVPKPGRQTLTRFQKITLRIHNTLMQQLVPLNGPGPILKWVFKIPLVFYHLGLGRFIGQHILILMTTGRRSGKVRRTPVEYSDDPERGGYVVMAGWGGHTDWVFNLRRNDCLRVYARGKEFLARAVPLTGDETARYMLEVAGLNPGALVIFSRWAQQPLEATLESLRPAAPVFPTFIIIPIESN